ncbi:phosphoribosylformylglycinamidine synthase [Oceanispirochaeta crateris]|uniref:Phosphoribosylformylglycinamidine synthase n=1 Tax=Oceanispirochaeta crateris TaxID=2518645 RepID=A0A5C1QGZ8_9SPIO|nr:phosphoribosylformylglycinamidine synthase [Oceanispirochaeta crateris]QEN07385.1 phosphoribosylformylglycinamidine synthase [Oceanispirochaeta crateris]
MNDFSRVLVEKRKSRDSEAAAMKSEIIQTLGIKSINRIRLINIYELTDLDEKQLSRITSSVFSEIPSDIILEKMPQEEHQFGIEFLPGQFDQRADSAAQCIHLIFPEWSGVVRSSRLIIVEGPISSDELSRIKRYCINPVESREKDLSDHSLFDLGSLPSEVPVLENFNAQDAEEIRSSMGLAMSADDIIHCQKYFSETEKRFPSETEIRVLDTYWSDHCRHTTFETEIKQITLPADGFHEVLQNTLDHYKSIRTLCDREAKPMTLMDLATISAKRQRKEGLLDDLEVSEEINACSVRINVDVDGRDEPWLLMFKNETHNHPTEIEPFGGASTCIGGAIRDPLSGRSYVYQAMRITGASDPCENMEETLPGKLPQKYICRTAAHGYSSYGNQIGLATSFVREIYDPGYKAKRMEVGAVVGAVPEYMVRRESPVAGDVVILIGGKTGRDGCGGATGSSKEHNLESLQSCSAEVQKGNAPEERKIQRLFRNPEVTKLIKKCNDFGAGGVSVAIGELSPGLIIDLDKIPTKYKGLNGTELAISESQERMAVVVSPEDKERIIQFAESENLDATPVADVTDTHRLILKWKGQNIVDLDRTFLDTNGVRQTTEVVLPSVNWSRNPFLKDPHPDKEGYKKILSSLNVCSQKGLVEMFDASIGGSTLQMPYGGKHQLSESEASIHKLPVQKGTTKTCSLLAYGFDPEISNWSPYHGSVYAVVSSLARLVVSGGQWKNTRLSFQEYFKRLGDDPQNWGLPFTALLGALKAQEELDIPAIGGKDSMSGTFHDIHVPPTLISFAVTTTKVETVVSSEFKSFGHTIYYLPVKTDKFHLPQWDSLKAGFDLVESLNHLGKIQAASTVKEGGIATQLFRMAVGNGIGFELSNQNIPLYSKGNGDILFESDDQTLMDSHPELIVLGQTIKEEELRFSEYTIALNEALNSWKGTLEPVFPDDPDTKDAEDCTVPLNKKMFSGKKPILSAAPRVFIPIFPGTNCEYDTQRSFQNAGAMVQSAVFCNRSRRDVLESIEKMVQGIKSSQIFMLSGGFSAGDEPEGSGKFIANVLLNPAVSEAIEDLLHRDGLILGICNGFQALVKSGLLPYGTVRELDKDSPTLIRNINNRHISKMVHTRVISSNSPWLANMNPGDVHTIAISHGEGRFTGNPHILEDLQKNGQIAFQYCDDQGAATMNPLFNPNGSDLAIEGISSACGKILGKMGHSERFTNDNFMNIPGDKHQSLFESGVQYFK